MPLDVRVVKLSVSKLSTVPGTEEVLRTLPGRGDRAMSMHTRAHPHRYSCPSSQHGVGGQRRADHGSCPDTRVNARGLQGHVLSIGNTAPRLQLVTQACGQVALCGQVFRFLWEHGYTEAVQSHLIFKRLCNPKKVYLSAG